MVEIRTSYEDEERFINIGKINPKVYAVVTTLRGEKIPRSHVLRGNAHESLSINLYYISRIN